MCGLIGEDGSGGVDKIRGDEEERKGLCCIGEIEGGEGMVAKGKMFS